MLQETKYALAHESADPEVLKLIDESWQEVLKLNATKDDHDTTKKDLSSSSGGYSSAPSSQATAKAAAKANPKAKQEKKSFFGALRGKVNTEPQKKTETQTSEEEHIDEKHSNASSRFDVPRTFGAMVELNASLTGANLPYIKIVLDMFEEIVKDFVRLGVAAENTCVLALRIAKEVDNNISTIRTSEFKVCMLASLRSLIPARWDSKHEQAWSWLWECLEAQLKESLPMREKYQKAVCKWVDGITKEQFDTLGLKVWDEIFKRDSESEKLFTQSNSRLIFIVTKAVQFSGEIYKSPQQMNLTLQELGIKHMMLGVEPRYFRIFLTVIEVEIRKRAKSDTVIEGIMWSMELVAMTLARMVIEGGLKGL